MGAGRSKYVDLKTIDEEALHRSREKKYLDTNENQRSYYSARRKYHGDTLKEFTSEERAFMTELLFKEPVDERERKAKYLEQQRMLAQLKLEEEMKEKYIRRLEKMEELRNEINERRNPVARRERKHKFASEFSGRIM